MFLKRITTKLEKLILLILCSYIVKMYAFNPCKKYEWLWWWKFQAAMDRYFDVNKSRRELQHSAFYLSSSSLFHMLLSESLQNLIFLPLSSRLLLSSYDIQIKWEFEKNLGNTINKNKYR